MNEEYFLELKGKIDGMMYICTLLLATHPQSKALFNVIKRMPTHGDQANLSSSQQSYINGIKWAVDNVEVGLKNAEHASLLRDLKPEGVKQ